MHVLSSFRITVIRYVWGTSAACTNDLSIIIVIGKGKYRKRIIVRRKENEINRSISDIRSSMGRIYRSTAR
ncbi:hypothetical protein COK05_00800 [Bacillus cereus]|uniref:Uncharacterized protein n=1 Tax=Bacillus cereus TaxID=1396 RepID=A0A2B2MFF9_BACCE|nr:hypothetical protein COK05_00800 [Bacillus cereus]PGU10964.1 hypothetical protein COD21_11580 [Bacillus cereus]